MRTMRTVPQPRSSTASGGKMMHRIARVQPIVTYPSEVILTSFNTQAASNRCGCKQELVRFEGTHQERSKKYVIRSGCCATSNAETYTRDRGSDGLVA